MQLTESWRDVFSDDVLARYDFAETRNAAAILRATSPEAFEDIAKLLRSFRLTLDKLVRPGGNRSIISAELDETMRKLGWREARFDQSLTTRLVISPWGQAPEPEQRQEVVTQNEYGGHKVDNVLGRAALDVEWNPKDGNLDRDLTNYVTLHDAGLIDAGVILTRTGFEMRDFAVDLVHRVKGVEVPEEYTAWHERMARTPTSPFGTSTTANFGKLVPRLERGDGRGCPVLAIAVTPRCYDTHEGTIEEEVMRIAERIQSE